MKNILKKFKKYLKQNDYRWTSQRAAILNTLASSKDHLTADDIYIIVKKNNPKIGRATVFRTLKLMVKAGIARQVNFGEKKARYELKSDEKHHDHLVCILCGRCYEFYDSEIERLQDKIVKKYEFLPKYHRMEIFGVCNKCKKKGD
ncbi:MAG: Fur family transcriptional regulator [Elusimicrobiota bacterium]